jgi:5-oxopent-3-ene-1,2,5-tricarboxylate decarboxylase / 2-hydroxyhepta-2,4-diene-1,7-dioate isomerase
MIAGNIYGVVLNDRPQLEQMAAGFAMPPYKAPPQAPVLYIKTRNCLLSDGGEIRLDGDLAEVEIAATLGLLFGCAATKVSRAGALDLIAAACLALDVSEPEASYYRPAVRQRCRDGFLPLGRPGLFDKHLLRANIETRINGISVHSWSAQRLARDAAALISDISDFMTLAAGDLLLIGLPHDAPRARAGDLVTVDCAGLMPLTAHFQSASAA